MKTVKSEQKSSKDAKREEREASLKDALRQNLHRRKAQARVRSDQKDQGEK